MAIVAMVPKLPFVPLVLTMPIVAMVPKLPFVPLERGIGLNRRAPEPQGD